MRIATTLIFSLILFLFPSSVSAQTNDVTSVIENIGNPSKTKWIDSNNGCRYARNVWDMEIFNGKIYIGSGNSSNTAPCANAGPVNIISYNPLTSAYLTESTINQGQIDRFTFLSGILTIPGHDPTGGDALQYYQLENGSWVIHTGIGGSSVKHVYDIASHNNQLFAAVGGSSTSVFVSTNNGINWTAANTDIGFRAFALFQLGGKFYAAQNWDPTQNFGGLFLSNGGTSFTYLSSILYAQMFPSTPVVTNSTDFPKIDRKINFLDSLVYIGTQITNDHQGDPFGIYKVKQVSPTGGGNFSSATRINLPANAKPWDLLIGADNKLYVLGSVQNGSRFWVTVSSTSDLISWTEEFRFDAPSFARSFGKLNDDWYFGLGTDKTTLSVASGDILRYKSQASPSPSASGKIGDIIVNNKVDLYDYNALLTDFGKKNDAVTKADLDDDNDVDLYDYNILLTNFGR